MRFPAQYTFALSLLIGSPAGALSQADTSACRLPDSTATDVLNWMKYLSTERVDSEIIEWRDTLRIPAASESEVVLVTEEPVCRAAREAWNAQLAMWNAHRAPELRPTAERVIVVEARGAYAVEDPERIIGEWGITIYFDRQWRFLNSSSR